MTFDLADLERAAGMTRSQLQKALRVSGTTITAAERDGIPEDVADKWACKLGLHPGCVWDQWVPTGLSVPDAIFLERGGWRLAWEWAQRRKAAAA